MGSGGGGRRLGRVLTNEGQVICVSSMGSASKSDGRVRVYGACNVGREVVCV